MYPAQADLRRVLDLTYAANLGALGTTHEELTGDWRATYDRQLAGEPVRVVTRDLGRAAFEVGFEAVKYPSAYNRERWNVVVFTENAETPPAFDLPQVLEDVIAALGGAAPKRKK